mmetsp:Transcript_474/g.992  ORF Transcript_474/g.992 Transcript_474/m.992 type:complete len:509 (+) Transcript_474:172-1698(+)|eukprot:CAMPEP_0114231370 /NCGR_PEP_ID=MMETSP0058-20121206/4005_1 /TAXON_ID=36894 /ORGANISM="Pyramimonas parkeae, CCMP726" /LENGTH=508 /DNA_ID=CAMNT_0001342709 /DNA_START=98 /DNA_END=1624 /DNA_ORIENTATION=+
MASKYAPTEPCSNDDVVNLQPDVHDSTIASLTPVDMEPSHHMPGTPDKSRPLKSSSSFRAVQGTARKSAMTFKKAVELFRNSAKKQTDVRICDIDLDLEFVKPLGEGAFGTVDLYLMTPHDNDLNNQKIKVAVKRIKEYVQVTSVDEHMNPVTETIYCSDEEIELFRREVKLLTKIKHVNIVEVLAQGSYTQGNLNKELPFVVQECMDSSLKAQFKKRYSMEQGLQWCKEIATGMAYLHQFDPIIIHRDLKPENILLRNHVAKVGDFGLFTTRADGDITEGRTPSFPLGPSSPKVQHQRSEWSHNGDSNATSKGAPVISGSGEVNMDNAYEIVERQHSGSINGGAYNKKSNVVPQRMKGPGLERRPSLFQVFGGKEEVTKRKRKMTGQTGSMLYMAPENFRGEVYDEKVDQFSFSMIMYCILSKKEHPYTDLYMLPEQVARAVAEVGKNFRPKLPSKWPVELKNFLMECWHEDPKQRPDFTDIVDRINNMMNDKEFMHALSKRRSSCC